MVGHPPQAALRLHAVMKIKPFGQTIQMQIIFNFQLTEVRERM
jgi:hypothetical protein